MKNKFYAMIFCVIAFLMLLSWIFYFLDKYCGIEYMFSTNKNAFFFLTAGIIIASIMTIILYGVVGILQIILFG